MPEVEAAGVNWISPSLLPRTPVFVKVTRDLRRVLVLKNEIYVNQMGHLDSSVIAV